MRLIFTCLVLGLVSPGLLSQSLADLSSTCKTVAPHLESRVDRIYTEASTSKTFDNRQLKHLFDLVHSRFLHHYVPLSDFNDLEQKQFDCLTATALFSHLLQRLQVDHQVIETSYHIFIIARTSEGRVLLETTDRWSGFVTDQGLIEEKIAAYRSYRPTSRELSNMIDYRYNTELFQVVPPEKISGLLLYNQAVKAFNNHQWNECRMLLARARQIYPTPRIDEMFALLHAVALR